MPRRMPFTLNSIVLLPLLQSLPASTAASVLVALVSMTTGLDFGFMNLARSETAADALVAWMMSFSVAAPACWAGYMAVNIWKWAAGFIRYLQQRRS
jgi:ABC-type dipeptide/oligopeptide/nickel transport system permease component